MSFFTPIRQYLNPGTRQIADAQFRRREPTPTGLPTVPDVCTYENMVK